VEKYWVVIQIRDTKYCKLGAQERTIFKLFSKLEKERCCGKKEESLKGPSQISRNTAVRNIDPI